MKILLESFRIAQAAMPPLAFSLMTFEQLSWGLVAAAALVVTLPSLFLTIFVQRDIVTGLGSKSQGIKTASWKLEIKSWRLEDDFEYGS